MALPPIWFEFFLPVWDSGEDPSRSGMVLLSGFGSVCLLFACFLGVRPLLISDHLPVCEKDLLPRRPHPSFWRTLRLCWMKQRRFNSWGWSWWTHILPQTSPFFVESQIKYIHTISFWAQNLDLSGRHVCFRELVSFLKSIWSKKPSAFCSLRQHL